MNPMQIDIQQVLKDKAPHTYFPKFFVRWLEKTIHAKEMNAFMATHTDVEGFDFARVYLQEGLHCSATIEGKENIPTDSKPLLFVSNHPLGGLDGIILAVTIGEIRKYKLRLIVNDLLLHLKPIANIFVPVNKFGTQSREYALRQQELWNSDMDIISFPAGICSRLQHVQGKGYTIQDLTWQKSFIRHAVKHQRDIVPIYFDGKNSKFFYRLAFWRKLFGIKLNIEQLFLPDEMYKAQGSHFTIRVGKPIPYTTFDNSRTPLEWAEWVKNIVYSL